MECLYLGMIHNPTCHKVIEKDWHHFRAIDGDLLWIQVGRNVYFKCGDVAPDEEEFCDDCRRCRRSDNVRYGPNGAAGTCPNLVPPGFSSCDDCTETVPIIIMRPYVHNQTVMPGKNYCRVRYLHSDRPRAEGIKCARFRSKFDESWCEPCMTEMCMKFGVGECSTIALIGIIRQHMYALSKCTSSTLVVR